MPRHPLGDKAMTDAERQRKRRQRLQQETTVPSDRQKLARAQAEIASLRDQLAAAARHEPAKPVPDAEAAQASQDVAQRSAETVLVEIHTVLKRNKWQHSAADRIILGKLFLEAQADIHAGIGPKPVAVAKRKAWQTKFKNAMDHYIKRCGRQNRCYVALSLTMIKSFINEARAA